MAVPHVSATAALIIGEKLLGPNPTPEAITTRLESTARDLGAPGRDPLYGYGLLNAAAATAPLQ
jgi:serine protease